MIWSRTPTITPAVLPLYRLITHSGRQCWPALCTTRTRSSWSHKLKHDSSEETTCYQSACQTLCSWARCRRRRRIGDLPGGGSCIKVHGEAGISTPVAVKQRAAICLEEAVWSFTAMWCRSSRADVTFRYPLPYFRVVQCHSLRPRITVELFCCTWAAVAR